MHLLLKGILIVILVSIVSLDASAQEIVYSPDSSVVVTVTHGEQIQISAHYKGKQILKPSEIGLEIRSLIPNWRIRKRSMQRHDENIFPPVAEKRKVIRDHYAQLTIEFRSRVSLNVRAYNDGFAYRFTSSLKDSITVDKEIARYAFPPEGIFYGSAVTKREDVDIFHTSFEEPYLIKPLDSVSTDLLFFSPVMIAFPDNIKTVITESDLDDYPGMFLKFDQNKILEGINAPYPLEVRMNPGEFPQEVVTRRADFIARTKGARTFPWRVFMLSE
ncbi:MAG TPA: glycoside hydrolase family 97 N-terminal domain-containing protein, partial [Chryseosolibacter sp.]|nr:glycoside hydrolase family 97 N-terminal domain-containing protein [Chryseosolibacter sp.]